MTDYGPDRYERAVARRKARRLQKKAQKLARKDYNELDILYDPDTIASDLGRDRFAEADSVLMPQDLTAEELAEAQIRNKF